MKVCATVAACPVGVAIVIGSPSGSESLPVTLENNGTSVKIVNESSEAFGKTDSATVSIEVRDLNNPAGNAPPIATDDVFTLFADVPLSSSVMSNDTDPDGDVISIADGAGVAASAAQTITTAVGGAVTLNADGTFTYTPPAGFLGEDTFDYTIVDPGGATDDATVTLNVIACLLYTSPSPRDGLLSRMPSSA